MSLLRLSFLGVKGFKMSVFCYKSQNSTFQPSKVARIQPIDDVPFVFYEKNLMNNMSSVQFNQKKRGQAHFFDFSILGQECSTQV